MEYQVFISLKIRGRCPENGLVMILYVVDILHYTVIDDNWGIGIRNLFLFHSGNIIIISFVTGSRIQIPISRILFKVIKYRIYF